MFSTPPSSARRLFSSPPRSSFTDISSPPSQFTFPPAPPTLPSKSFLPVSPIPLHQTFPPALPTSPPKSFSSFTSSPLSSPRVKERKLAISPRVKERRMSTSPTSPQVKERKIPAAPERKKLFTRSLSTAAEQTIVPPTYEQLYPLRTLGKNRIIENFETLDKKEIGSGDYGRVYRLTNPYSDFKDITENIAVKKLLFKSPLELKTWPIVTEQCGFARHTLPLWGAWSSTQDKKEQIYLASPFCEATLQNYLDTATSSPVLRKVLPDLLDALTCLRSTQIYHRDIKPANIFYCSSAPKTETKEETTGEWVLADYGISIEEKEYAALQAETKNLGSGEGEAAYLAKADVFSQYLPSGEIILPPGYSYASDIYSLGKVMQKIFPLIPLTPTEKIQLAKVITAMTQENYLLRPSLEEIQEATKFL